MPIYDFDGTTYREIGKSYDYDGTTYHQHKEIYDFNGTTYNLLYKDAIPFTVANFETTAKSNYTYHNGTSTVNSASFTIQGNSTITMTATGTLAGNFRGDYMPGHGFAVRLRQSGTNALLKELSYANVSQYRNSPQYPSFNVSSFSGSCYLELYVYARSQNINNPDGTQQTVQYKVALSNISGNV